MPYRNFPSKSLARGYCWLEAKRNNPNLPKQTSVFLSDAYGLSILTAQEIGLSKLIAVNQDKASRNVLNSFLHGRLCLKEQSDIESAANKIVNSWGIDVGFYFLDFHNLWSPKNAEITSAVLKTLKAGDCFAISSWYSKKQVGNNDVFDIVKDIKSSLPHEIVCTQAIKYKSKKNLNTNGVPMITSSWIFGKETDSSPALINLNRNVNWESALKREFLSAGGRNFERFMGEMNPEEKAWIKRGDAKNSENVKKAWETRRKNALMRKSILLGG